MTIPASVMARMATIGLSAEQAEAVALMLEAVETATKAEAGVAIEARRSADRERKSRQRHGKSRDITGQDVTERDNLSPKERSPTPPKEITPIPVSEPIGSSTETRAFDQFWSIYPNRVGKRDAEKALSKALKRADLSTILAGLRRYVAKTDDRPWCNPATWLNQDRWDDAPATVPQQRTTGPPRKPSAFDAYDEISRLKGWTDEPASIPGNHENAERLPAVSGGSTGPALDLRRGHDWHS